MKDNWKEDLLSEKSLRQAYLVSKELARSKFNWWAYWLSLVALVIVGTIWTIKGDVGTSYKALISLSETAFDLTAQILGFLIGGFAIFATISDSKLMVRLAQTKMQDSELSVFKTVFYNFISVFYIYVLTLSIAVVIEVASSLDIMNANGFTKHFQPFILTGLNAIAFAIVGMATTLCILRLKSFIWNIYQAFLTFLIVADVVRQHERREGGEG